MTLEKWQVNQAEDMLIVQTQSAPTYSFNPDGYSSFDVRFSHSVKCLYFNIANISIQGQRSNYTTDTAVVTYLGDNQCAIEHSPGTDVMSACSLIYENTVRLGALPSMYYSLLQPYYQPSSVSSIPTSTGYHLYSYALDKDDTDPTGSTNLGKISNTSLVPVASAEAKTAKANGQSFEMNIVAVNWNIFRLAGGSGGFHYCKSTFVSEYFFFEK